MTGSVLFTIVLTVLWFITGVRDLMGKDPLINLPFNQYNRDPEYRAFWQKKNGIWELANGITFGLSNVLIDHMQDAAADEAGRQRKRNRERIAGEAR